MRWTERQRAMLREMGIRLWWPEGDGDTALADPDDSPAAPAAAPASARASAPASPLAAAASGGPAPQPRREAARVPGLAAADWLLVSEPLERGDPQQEQLLENMLRAIGVGLVAPDRERRAVLFPLDLLALDAAGANGTHGGTGSAPLRAALDAVAPRCVLAFGRAAAAALLGADAPLGGLRGRVHAHAGVPVVVTFSLAFLLRHPAEKAKAWADLCLAVRALEAPAA
jgi:DNA polymerase